MVTRTLTKLTLILSLPLISCGKQSTTDSTTSTASTLNGTYLRAGIICTGSTGAVVAASSVSASYADTLILLDGAFTQVSMSSGCTVAVKGSLSASSTALSFTGMTVASTTGSSCSLAQTIAAGTITPTTITTTYTLAASLTDITDLPYSFGELIPGVDSLLIKNADYSAGAGTTCYTEYLLK